MVLLILWVLLVTDNKAELYMVGAICTVVTAVITAIIARPKAKADTKLTTATTKVTEGKEARDQIEFHEKEWEKLEVRYSKLEQEYQKALQTIEAFRIDMAELRKERDEAKRQYTLLKMQKS